LVGVALEFSVHAQFPDVLSASECAGCAQTAFEGTWSTALTAPYEPYWELADFFCFAACTAEGRATATSLLTEPRDARRSALELYPEAVAANSRSVVSLLIPASNTVLLSRKPQIPALACAEPSFAQQVVSPLPLKIERRPGELVLRYEELGVERIVRMDGRTPVPPDDDIPFGVATGRFEGTTLVVETTRIASGRLSPWLGGSSHSNELHAIERYSIGMGGLSLELVLELDDPRTLARLVVTKRWLRSPGGRIAIYRCDVMSAGLAGTFAEYLDPRIIDARRRAAHAQ
jgi:hypothetical protein